jgi:hypothetical protein
MGATAATEFGRQVKKLGLMKETFASYSELRTWCKRNKHRVYIPEQRTSRNSYFKRGESQWIYIVGGWDETRVTVA